MTTCEHSHLEVTGDGEIRCIDCNKVVGSYVHVTDFSPVWQEGHVWTYCPHCQSGPDDGIYIKRYVEYKTCPKCGGQLARDEDRR